MARITVVINEMKGRVLEQENGNIQRDMELLGLWLGNRLGYRPSLFFMLPLIWDISWG